MIVCKIVNGLWKNQKKKTSEDNDIDIKVLNSKFLLIIKLNEYNKNDRNSKKKYKFIK